VGKNLVETTAKMDDKGRIRIPRQIRQAAQLKEGSCVTIKAKKKTIIIEPAEPAADRYYGAFKVEKWPEDLHKYSSEEMRKRWKQRGT
jgi:AbrB family looped-hinge helix DNA binding protein